MAATPLSAMLNLVVPVAEALAPFSILVFSFPLVSHRSTNHSSFFLSVCLSGHEVLLLPATGYTLIIILGTWFQAILYRHYAPSTSICLYWMCIGEMFLVTHIYAAL